MNGGTEMDVSEKLVELLAPTSLNFEEAVYLVDYLVKNGVTVQEWISVKDRLPKRPPDRVDDQGRSWFTTGIECLVYDGKNVFAAHYCFMNKCFWYSDTLHPLKNITHWMPIPQPPKETDYGYLQ